MAENLQSFTKLSKFASKNGKIPISLGRVFHCLPILTKNDWKNSVL